MSLATITILDVGHGSSAVVHTADSLCLIDAGAGSTVLEYMSSMQPQVINSVLISHADRDHVGGLIGLLSSQAFKIGTVWLNADAFKGSRLWRDLTSELDSWEHEGGVTRVGVKKGDVVDASPLTIDVLAPRTRIAARGPGARDDLNRRLEANSLSVVARVMLGEEPVALFPGDLDSVGLDHLLDYAHPPSLKAPVLAFPHHGGHVSRAGSEQDNILFTEKLLGLVQPSTVVFSIGREEHGTPRPEIVRVARSMVPNIRIACTQLSKRCAVEPPQGPVAHLLSETARGRAYNSCCAGSLVIHVDSNGQSVAPDASSHRTFIDLNAPLALCR